MKFPQLIASITTDRPLAARPSHVRGFFSHRQPENILLHQHHGSGEEHQFVYIYPRVQYRVTNSVEIIGVSEGVEAVSYATERLEEMLLLGERYRVDNIERSYEDVEVGDCADMRSYEFVSPWLALSQKNFHAYQRARPAARRELLQRILVGNILSMCKSMGYHVNNKLHTRVDFCAMTCNVKGRRMLSFRGGFLVNFAFPSRLGLGHLVSIGYGEVALKSQ